VTSYSLRWRLTLYLIAANLAIWCVVLYSSHRASVHEADELFDSRLVEVARALVALDIKGLQTLSNSSAAGHTIDDQDGDDDSAQSLAFQVWRPTGELLLRTPDAPPRQFSNEVGFELTKVNGEEWRAFSLWNENESHQVRVFERSSIRKDWTHVVVSKTIEPLLWSLPFIVLIVWLTVGMQLRPLGLISRDLSQHDADHLGAVSPLRVPREILPLKTAINDLMARLAKSIDKERHFTADAAHELRTPLAAISVQAEMAMASASDPERFRALTNIVSGLKRLTDIVQQLLTLTRLDHESAIEKVPLQLKDVVQDCLARTVGDALQKNIELDFADSPLGPINGNVTLIYVMLQNLLHNALNYVPSGGRVEVSIVESSRAVTLQVKDNGAGMPAETRERIFDRFYRGTVNQLAGSGLGLAIVKEIAVLHNAEVSAGTGIDARGLGINVVFPSICTSRQGSN
jgi:two-component system, OmpR family, sensor histidine kinase QseC